MKLTEAQRDLLVHCADPWGTYVVGRYPPAKTLVRKGLAEWEDGNPDSHWLNITPAGRAALQEGQDG